MRVMALGPYQFQAIGLGFTGRSKSQKTAWAEIEVAGGMNRSQWTGGQSRSETISGVIFSEFGGQGSINGLKLAAQLGTPLPLVDLASGLSNVFGMHVIEEISEEQDVFDAAGAPIRNAYSIKLRRYETGGSPFTVVSVLSLFA